MPTGYTAILLDRDDVSLKEFTLRCARAFGALIEMRDDGLEVPIPEKFEPDPYHAKELVKAEKEFTRLCKLSNKEKIALGINKKTEAQKEARQSLARVEGDNKKFSDMIEKVESWKPPTKDHVELKNFMIEQLEMSLSDTKYHKEGIAKCESKSPMDFYTEAVSSAQWSVEYHTRDLKESQKRLDGRNNWLLRLRASL